MKLGLSYRNRYIEARESAYMTMFMRQIQLCVKWSLLHLGITYLNSAYMCTSHENGVPNRKLSKHVRDWCVSFQCTFLESQSGTTFSNFLPRLEPRLCNIDKSSSQKWDFSGGHDAMSKDGTVPRLFDWCIQIATSPLSFNPPSVRFRICAHIV